MSPVESIDRTPEYDKFITELKAFHDRKGTFLQVEPILGGKKLDLLKIYKTVIAAGGYEKVTTNRGWKQVGDPFNFPATCTNSAYVLKSVYTRYLLGWEEEFYWKRPWNPPAELLTNYQKDASPLPANSSRESSNRQTGTAFVQPPRLQQLYQPQQQQQLQPQQQQQPPQQIPYQQGIFKDYEFRTRILLSLQSSLPNEIDWAFNTLVKFSYASENFSLDFIPTLIDLLLDFTVDFFKQHIEAGDHFGSDVFCSKETQESYERVLQVFHILRNFSFLEMNIRRLALHERLTFLLMKGIRLPPHSKYGELSRHCLDILENIAPQVLLTSREDAYLTTMRHLLFSNDRAFILGAIRALTRVAVTEANEKFLSYADADVIERIAQFLLTDDEELEAATLEYLYQYSSLRGNFSTQLIKCYPGNLVGLLTGFLSYKSSLVSSQSALGTIHGIPAAQLKQSMESAGPQQPPSIPDLTNYANLDEPYRCLGWLKDKLIVGSEEDEVSFKELFNSYRGLFESEKPLGMKEFYTVLKIAFPQPSSVEDAFTNHPTPIETMLKNVKYSPTRRIEGPICHWDGCNEHFDNSVDLHKHIIQQHLENQQSCHWMKCNKSLDGKTHAIQHMRTHFVGKIKKPAPKKSFAIAKIPVDDSEVSGVPLTAALLLRNLARHKNHHIYYFPYESELTLLAIQRPKISKYILTVLWELQAN